MMKTKQIHSNNPKIQAVLDDISRFRQRVIKEGSVSAWYYSLVKQFVLEISQGHFRQAVYLLRFRVTMYIRQGFEVDPYLDWMVTSEPSPFEAKQRRAQVETFPTKPLISIVTPVFRPAAPILTKMLDSVAEQI